MKILDNILLNTSIIITPILIYLLYNAYTKIQDKDEDNIIFSLTIIMQIYLILKYAIPFQNHIPLLIIDIPLLLAYQKKDHLLIILVSIFNIIYYNVFYQESLLIIIMEYTIYYLLSINKKINYFWIIKIVFVIYYKSLSLSIIICFLLFIILSTFSIYLLKKTEEMLNIHSKLKKISKEKEVQTSLFKITHEIKNPIAVCKGYLDMYDETKEETEKYIPIIKEEIDRVLILLEDFLSMNKQKINKEIVDINLLLEETIQNMNLLFKNKKITLNSNISDEEIYINADYNRLTQVFINILKNSIEALESKKNPNISLWTNINKDNIYIHIKDNGIGINKEKIKKIKEPFYTTKVKGTGLGVSLSNEIIKSHNGNLKYKSKENEYTEVIITLPLEKAI